MIVSADPQQEDLAGWIERGRALIVGLAGEDRRPRVTRGWGLRVLRRDDRGCPARIRLLLDGAGAGRIPTLQGSPLAVTGCDVRTLASAQLKGWIEQVGPADEADVDDSLVYAQEMFGAIEDADGIPMHLLQRLVPHTLVAVEVEVDAVFDQTPGPGAGASLGGLFGRPDSGGGADIPNAGEPAP